MNAIQTGNVGNSSGCGKVNTLIGILSYRSVKHPLWGKL